MKGSGDGSRHCRNLNHGRWNIAINYCPDCGARLASRLAPACNLETHAALRKQRLKFCTHCGTKLNK